jgi:hypothetical protein
MVYPATKSQVTPRKRAVGIRPRTLNYHCEISFFQVGTELISGRLVAQSPAHYPRSARVRRPQSTCAAVWLIILHRQ